MRKLLFATLFSLLVANGVRADESQAWAVRNGANWTQNDNVQINYFFTENGTPVGQAQLFIGPLLPTDPDRPVVTSQFINSGKTICLNVESFRSVDSSTRVVSTPKCHTFRFGPLDAATIIDTP